MKLNKVYEGECFEAVSLEGYSRCDLLPYENESVEGVKEGIDRWNETTKKHGYQPKQWLITRKVWNRITSPDGVFVASHESVTVVEMYPREL